MIAVVCIDDNGGMLFNNRRLSRDRILIEDLIKTADGRKIYIEPFSETLFNGKENYVLVTDDCLSGAGEDDYCFVENKNISAYRNKIKGLIIYKWNRKYPSDLKFDFDLSDYKLNEVSEFGGSSHEKITKEIYSLF